MITSLALNAAELDPLRHFENGPTTWSHILKVLSVDLLHSHHPIVLGAWGCGAFGNDTDEIAALFHRTVE